MAFDFDNDGLPVQSVGGFDFDDDGAPVVRKPAKPGAEGGGFAASVKQTIGSTIRGAGQAAGDFIPGVDQNNAVTRYGQEVIDANPTAVRSLDDIRDKPWTAVKEATGNAAGSVGGVLGARALGMGITAASPMAGPAAPIVALAGQAIAWFGPAAIAALPSYGSIREKQILNDPAAENDAKAKAIATLGAATVGAIETKFGPQEWALSTLTKEGRKALAKKFAETTVAKAIGFGALKGAAIEGGEELVQNPIEQLASFDDPTSPESLKDTAFGGAMSVIGGGVFGGGAGAVVGKSQNQVIPPTHTRPEVKDIGAAQTVDEAILAADAVLAAPLEPAAGMAERLMPANPVLDGARSREDLQAFMESETRNLQVAMAQAEEETRRQRELDQIQQAGRQDLGRLPDQQVANAIAATDETPTAMQLAMQRALTRQTENANVSPPTAIQPGTTGAAGGGMDLAAPGVAAGPGNDGAALPAMDAGGTAAQLPATDLPQPAGPDLDALRTDNAALRSQAIQALQSQQGAAAQVEPAPAVRADVPGTPQLPPVGPAALEAGGVAPVAPAAPSARQVAIDAEKARIEEKRAQRRAAAQEASQPMEGLSVGSMPTNAEPVSVKDGVVYIGKYPAQNFDTGENVTVPAGATPQQIAAALRESGALGKRAKFFGLPANESPAQIPQKSEPTLASPEQQRADFAAAEKTRTAPGNRARSRAHDANPFKDFIAKHGISAALAAEFAPGQKERQAAMVQGYGPVFRKSGLQLDALAELAVQDGYLTSPDVTRLSAMIGEALRGKRIIPQYAEGAAETEIEARAALEKDTGEAQNAEVEAETQAEREAIQAVAELSDDNPLLADSPNITAGNNTSLADFLRAMGATEQEIANETAGQDQGQGRARQDDQGAGRPQETSPAQAPPDSGRRDGQARPDEKGLSDESQRLEGVRKPAARIESSWQDNRARSGDKAGVGESTEGNAVTPESQAEGLNNEQENDASGTGNKNAKEAAATSTGANRGTAAVRKRTVAVPSADDQKTSGLTAPTRTDIEAQQDRAEAGARAEAKAKTDTEQRARADSELPDFTLTGSDRPADQAEARGQGGLFDRPASELSAAQLLRAAADKMEQKAPAQPITDFGEKIGGARKDVWTSYRDSLGEVTDDEIASQPLSKIWPLPDYQAMLDGGADPWTVGFMRAARDEVPAKPRVSYKVKRWAETVKLLRGVTTQLVDGTIDAAKARAKLAEAGIKSRGLLDIAGRIDLYMAVGHRQSLEGVRISSGQYSIYRGVEYNPSKVFWTVEKEMAATAFSNWPRELAIGDTRAEAIANFKAKYDSLEIQPQASKEVSFDIFVERGKDGFFIGKKIGRNIATLEGPFPDVKSAREYRAKNQQGLLTKLEKVKEIPSERRDTNEPRVGEDMRAGQDATPQMFSDAFGFRGVEFGNYVEQKKRQQDLNDAYDGLMDMAAILGIPPRAISLNGELGLAFGARGTGGKGAAAAHYERDFMAINLTKREGAGSLGHEWWHAADNYFSRMRGNRGDYMTEALDVSLAARKSNFIANTAVRREMIEAFGSVVRAIKNTALKARSSKLDAKRTKDYWTTGREMAARAFESYLISKLQDQNASNDYLANIVDEGTWKAAESMGFELDDSYPYPTAGEIPEIRAGFDHFFQTVQTLETDKGVAMFARDEGQLPAVINPSTVANVRAAITELLGGKQLANGLGRIVATTSAEIKSTWEPLIGKNVQIGSEGEAGVAQAFFEPGTKTVFMIADHINVGTEMAVLAHELMHKHGQAVLGKAGWDRLHGMIGTWKDAAEDSDERFVYDYATRKVQAVGEELSTQELFPYAVEAAIRMGVKPSLQAKRGTVANWLESVRQSLKTVWGKITGKPETFKAQDLVDLAFGIAQMENQDSEVLRGALADQTETPDGQDIRYSRTQIIGQTNRQHTPDQLRAMRNVGFEVDVPTIKERAQALWQDAGKKLAQGIVDQFAPVKDLDKEAYGLLRLAKGASGAFEVFLHGGKLKLTDGVYDYDDQNKGGVIDKLLIPLQGEHHDFMRWIAANRAERLTAEGRENLFTPQDIADLKTLADGTTDFDYTMQTGPRAGTVTRDRTLIYADAQRVFNAFNKNVLDLAEQSGLIDGASRHLWEHEFYVPFYRVAEEDGGVRGANIKGGVVRQEAFKKLKGGTQELNADLLDNTLMNWAHLLDAAAKNRAAKATIEAAEKMGAATQVPTGTKKSVWFMDKGEKHHAVVGDPYLLTAITSLEYAGMRNPVMNAMGAFKHYLTMGVTASPFFKVRNLIRDSMQVVATSGISPNVLTNVGKGWALTNPQSEEYFRLMAGGGTIHFGTMLEGSEAKRVQALVESGVDDATILNNEHKVKQFYRKFIEPGITAYNELGNRGEAINRASLYDQLRKQGVNHADASLQARDLMDFSMQGSFTTIRFLTQVVPFFNARLQGMYKLGRSAKEDPKRMAAVIGAASLMSLALLAAYGDDDDWKKREEWDRNNYWWFKFGGTAFRIPKPFEIGAMATLAERGFELMFDKEMTGKRFRKQVLTLLGDNLSMNPVPQLVKPILDVYANKDSFTGRPIETMGMDRLEAEYRFTDRTSMLARGTSTAANAVTGLVGAEGPSPVQIDHMLRGYFGWLGAFVVGAGDIVARPMTGQAERASPDMWKVATGGMVADVDSASSRYVSQMYDQAKEIERAYATWKNLVKEDKTMEAGEYLKEHRDEIVKHRSVSAVKAQETKLNQRIRMIERSNMEPDKKRDQIKRLQEQKDRIARQLSK